MTTCKECKHWDNGTCSKIPCDSEVRDDGNMMALICGYSQDDYTATLQTSPNFFCALWEVADWVRSVPE
jgi:hypothetical protein